jgi:hypothetical protein
MSIGSFFTKKIGPLPVWGYGAIAAGGTFILLKGGGKGKKGSQDSNGSGNGNGSQGGANGTVKSNLNTTETISSDQTFGGGSLGFLGWPGQFANNIFVHLHPHPHGGFYRGGRHYSDHGFESHGHGRDGGRRGGDDHRHGAFGGRGFGGFRGPEHGGQPRGFGQGHYTPSGGIGARIASAFNPRNSGNRRGVALTSTHPNADALPTGNRRG